MTAQASPAAPLVIRLGPGDLSEAVELLASAGLPTGDLSERRVDLSGLRDARGLAGVVGLEVLGDAGLLRSLAVRPDRQGTGLGGVLVAGVEALARAKGVRRLYLLTTTAAGFFRRLGYLDQERAEVPEAVRATSQFSALCPASASVLARPLPQSGERKWRVLIVCTGNSARSQIAEALLSVRGSGRFEVVSAGSHPAPAVHPLAVQALAEVGIPWQGRAPKGLDGLAPLKWDLIITVCDAARDACPLFPGQPLIVHWGMPDPAAHAGSSEERVAAFRRALETLDCRMDLLLRLPVESLAPEDARARLTEIGAAAV